MSSETGNESIPSTDDYDGEREEDPYQNEVQDLVAEIDFTDTSYILQNLSIAQPRLEDDKTFLMSGRRLLRQQVSAQVSFYVYCALKAFEKRKIPPSILIFGDGFIGSEIISDLVNLDLGHIIKIYSRGIIKAKAWKAKGLTANCSILHLLNGQRPDIVIISAESSNFTQISSMLVSKQIISTSSCVISASFGVERKKIYGNLGVQSIFRTFCEPSNFKRKQMRQRIKSNYAKPKDDDSDNSSFDSMQREFFDAIDEDASEKGDGDVDEDENKEKYEGNGRPAPLVFDDEDEIQGTKDDDFKLVMDDSDDEDGNENGMKGLDQDNEDNEAYDDYGMEENLSEIEKSANILARRLVDLRHFIHQLENYYSLTGLVEPLEAREIALRAALGYDSTQKLHEYYQSYNHTNTAPLYYQILVPPTPSSQKLTEVIGEMPLDKFLAKGAAGAGVTVGMGGYLATSGIGGSRHHLETSLQIMHQRMVAMFQIQLRKYIDWDEVQALAQGAPDQESLYSSGIFASRETDDDPNKRAAKKVKNALYTNTYTSYMFELDNDIMGHAGPGFAFIAEIDGKIKRHLKQLKELEQAAMKGREMALREELQDE